ncbi:MAG: U32 family peptidase [Firmicutes bacterium]|nr:U32 family peptidase [Bacillota bacterium]
MKNALNKPEILAPVGGSEQLLAAVRSGADAVYFGLQNFNARRNAENFAGEGLADTVAYCHIRGVKVYITINILVKDSELSDMKKAVDTAALAGADGIIVQDLAVARYIRSRWPGLPLFASTQLVCHNAEGVRELKKLGFSKFVLARELSLAEIRQVIERTGEAVEVFVHGAHCMSVSGACYMSAMIGGRSGNRGLCAQPCRLDWRLNGKEYALSLKDLSYVEHMKELAEIGVASFKIEGRMKRAEYVAAAVTACRRALEGETPDLDTLRSVFSRSGFTDGHLTGKRGPAMFGYRTKDDVVAAAGVFKSLQQLYEKEMPRVDVDMFLNVTRSENPTLTVTDGEHASSAEGAPAQEAVSHPLTEEAAFKSLSKTGGTPYRLRELGFYADEGLMLPVSQLNAMRRDALAGLNEQRAAIPDRSVSEEGIGPDLQAAALAVSSDGFQESVYPWRIRFETAAQLEDSTGTDGRIELTAEQAVILPLSVIEQDPSLISRYGDQLMAELPAMLWPGMGAKVLQSLKNLKRLGLARAYVDNIGAVEIARSAGLFIHGGFCLNLLNSVTVDEYRALGLTDSVLSMELSYANLRRLSPSMPVGTVVYGRMPLMKLRACPARGEKGCGSCDGHPVLSDRMGEQFPMLCRSRQYSEILNCVPQYTADKGLPANCFKLVYFTVETAAQCRAILKNCQEKSSPAFRRTAGLSQREIE